MNLHTIKAVFFRNFYSYFSNPTGYAFICVFVLLSTLAAFWQNGFFVNNLANLDQLTPLFPFVMLVFIPAVTMSIWAGERKMGTDELLLTLPASDMDIVLGKYLAAAAIYSASLAFSAVSNWVVLRTLGNPDIGLFGCTYFGYWLVGLAMLSVGMAASFLTEDLTVSYILGALFNAPLVFASYAEVAFFTSRASQSVGWWSLSARLAPFGNGVASLASIFYFLALAALMLYWCKILIGKRRWSNGGRCGRFITLYFLRFSSLLVILFSITSILNYYDIQWDCTSEKINSLSPETSALLADLPRPVEIHAYLSPELPQEYVATKYNIEATLRKMAQRSNGKIRLSFHYITSEMEDSLLAEEDFGIMPQKVNIVQRGKLESDDIYLGLAITSGLNRDVIPFFSSGLSVEYEVVRALLKVVSPAKKKLGILQTDAKLMGGFDHATLQYRHPSRIVRELEKTYELVPISAAEPIPTDEIEMLLAVQPTTLPPNEFDNFITAVREGMPTAIFEDPMPVQMDISPTNAPRRPPRGTTNPFMQGDFPKPDRAARQTLWYLLGVKFDENQIVSQHYNPIPRLAGLYPQFVFVDRSEMNPDAFPHENPVAKGLRRVVIPFGGHITQIPQKDQKTTFAPLIVAGTNAGLVSYENLLRTPALGCTMTNILPDAPFEPKDKQYIVAAEIQKQLAQKKKPIHVVLTADADLISDLFFQFREESVSSDVDFDNVTFFLNVVDRLCGEERFYAIRDHRPTYRKLVAIDRITSRAQKANADEVQRLLDQFKALGEAENRKIRENSAHLEEELLQGNLSPEAVAAQREVFEAERQKQLAAKLMTAERELNKNLRKLRIQLQQEIYRAQMKCKLLAVLIPPLFPMCLGLFVFVRRRRIEPRTRG
ncbi:MAG: Gldg family protein [Planctomycetia bacterium]|nr:Gldg family protein [Planctomycetia bacterium]